MKSIRHITALSLMAIFLCSCSSEKGAGNESESNKASTPQAQKAEAKMPEGLGVFYDSSGEPLNLMANPTVSAENPTFIIHLEKKVPVEKLRLRFGASGTQSIVVLKTDEKGGVFEAKITPVENREAMYRAVYQGTLKPGQYTAYSFTDESKGKQAWEEAQFKLAGQFTVK